MPKSKGKIGNMWKRILMGVAVVALLCLWMLGISRTSSLTINEIIVDVDQVDGERNLISSKEIKELVKNEMPNDITFQSINDLDISLVERMLNSDTRVLNTEVFIDAQQNMVIDVVQRRPILRVMNQQGDQFYVDQSGSYVKKVDNKATRVPVVTGYVERLDPDGHVAFTPRLERAFRVITETRKDRVLKALIEQVHIEKENRIVIIPKIGDERIILDHLDGLEKKLSNLKQFYRELARTDSWKKYNEINISYNNQVVVQNSDNP